MQNASRASVVDVQTEVYDDAQTIGADAITDAVIRSLAQRS